MLRIKCWGRIYYSHTKEPQISTGTYLHSKNKEPRNSTGIDFYSNIKEPPNSTGTYIVIVRAHPQKTVLVLIYIVTI